VYEIIRPNDGQRTKMHIVGCAPERVAIGMPVCVRYLDVDATNGPPFTLAMFEAA